jgi:hypothetical protein
LILFFVQEARKTLPFNQARVITKLDGKLKGGKVFVENFLLNFPFVIPCFNGETLRGHLNEDKALLHEKKMNYVEKIFHFSATKESEK